MTVRGRWGCALLLAYPLVEIILAVAVARIIGWWWVLVIVIGCIVLGLGLVRYSLGATGQSLRSSLGPLRDERGGSDAQRPAITSSAHRNVAAPAQTLLIVPAGLLIAMPGFVTTLMGAALWMPPVRCRIAQRWEDAARRAMPPGPGRATWPEEGPDVQL
ncbi:MAG: FxsA family protein [Candidatus Nanopelagicales bacterium]